MLLTAGPVVEQDDGHHELTSDPDDSRFLYFAVVQVSRGIFQTAFPNDETTETICLKRGTPLSHISDYYEGIDSSPEREGEFPQWFRKHCQQAEFGMVSFVEEPLKVYWMNPSGEEMFIGDLNFGEPNTLWRSGYLGHDFIVRAAHEQSQFEPVLFSLKGAQFMRIGEQEPIIGGRGDPEQGEYDRYHQGEMVRAARIKKIFTNTGYQRMPVPRKLWASIRAWWNMNREPTNTFSVSD